MALEDKSLNTSFASLRKLLWKTVEAQPELRVKANALNHSSWRWKKTREITQPAPASAEHGPPEEDKTLTNT